MSRSHFLVLPLAALAGAVALAYGPTAAWLAAWAPASAARRVLLVAASVPLAIVANVLRIVATAVVGLAFSGEAAAGFFEQGSGVLFFLLVTLGLCLLLPPARPAAPEPPSPSESSAQGSLLPALFALVAVAASSTAMRDSIPPPRAWDLRAWVPSVEDWSVTRLEAETLGLDQGAAAFRLSQPVVPPIDVLVRIEDDPRYLHAPELCSTAAGWMPDWRRQDQLLCAGQRIPLTVIKTSRGRDHVLVASWAAVDGEAARDSLDFHLRVVGARLRRGRCTVLQVEAATGFESESEAEVLGRLKAVLTSVHEEAERLMAR